MSPKIKFKTVKSFCTIGIDVGSRTTKGILWDGEKVVYRELIATGWSPSDAAAKIYADINSSFDSMVVKAVSATGFARKQVGFASENVTEITAHAAGIGFLLPEIRTLIDVGGQDSKVILLGENGMVADFAMNDRCSAGSGRFLEYLALSMGVTIDEFAQLGLKASRGVTLSSICTVFAESEMLSLLAEGASRNEVARGIHRAIARRIAQLAAPLNPIASFGLSGGGAYNTCLKEELESILGQPIVSPEFPEYAGALGAAILAGRKQSHP